MILSQFASHEVAKALPRAHKRVLWHSQNLNLKKNNERISYSTRSCMG